jgi:hypothetical protein
MRTLSNILVNNQGVKKEVKIKICRQKKMETQHTNFWEVVVVVIRTRIAINTFIKKKERL